MPSRQAPRQDAGATRLEREEWSTKKLSRRFTASEHCPHSVVLMVTARMRALLSAVIGIFVGYGIWLGAVAVVIVAAPVRLWVPSVAVLLAILTSIAVALAIRNKRTPRAVAFWLAPMLPILVSLYLIIVFAA